MAEVFIIDDDASMCEMLANLVGRLGHEARYAQTLKEGLEEILSHRFDVVMLDVMMPDGNGLDLLPQIRATPQAPEVVIITGAGDPDSAEIAIKNGAWDYIQKPLSPKKMILPLTRVLKYRDDLKKIQTPAFVLKRGNIIGDGPRMKACLEATTLAANSEANVLLTGETGTGKELFARAIHENSPRAHRNFIIVDCASLTETLAESALFGHEKGAYTGAVAAREGLVKQADGGTLFLDEIGELSLSLQKILLRILQEHRYRPLGGKEERESNFRLVAATNRDLRDMIDKGLFRQDLFYRIQSVNIQLPPIREHKEDIRDLAIHHIKVLCERYGVGMKGLSPELLDLLESYLWPGNVREMVNSLEHTIISAIQEPILLPQHMPNHIRIDVARASIDRRTEEKPIAEEAALEITEGISGSSFPDLRTLLEQVEKHYCETLMHKVRGNVPEACRISGLSRTRLYERLKKYGIRRTYSSDD